MEQPELGKKLAELRKVRGLTQEELADKCSIGIRTVQRIENGSVTPRAFTLRTILAALNCEISIFYEEDSKSNSFNKWLRHPFLTDTSLSKTSSYIMKQLNMAWIIGTVYFILGFFESAADFYIYVQKNYFKYTEDLSSFDKTAYAVIKIAVLVTSIYFQRGFILIGSLFKNYLLRITSLIQIFCFILLIGYEIVSLYYNSIEKQFIMGGFALTFGSIGIVYGIALTRLKKEVGKAAKYAGVFEIIAGFFFITIVLSFLGFIFLIPAELFEIILIYKVAEIYQTKQDEPSIVTQ